jgi:D-sedoheptulose 7-phosphate isomerase
LPDEDLPPAPADRYDAAFEEHARVLARTRAALREPFERLVRIAGDAIAGGGKLLFFGNGGSAADAQHLATELTVRFEEDRRALPALALTTDTSALTAIGNDLGFEVLYARQVEALGRPGDLAVALTTSGRSANVTLALKAARAGGLAAAALTGRDGGALPGLADPLLIVPADNTARIQEMHILLGHLLCRALEDRFGRG